ncbi:MAG: sporulation integral membrane protein YtvI [Oscillospiraceae bacterium]|nr:sporulation integral membrane protein YtvI [Oscillospiraceae bacterium]
MCFLLEKYKKSYKKLILYVFIVIGAFFTIKYALDIIFPFVFGFFVAALMRWCAKSLVKVTGLNSKTAGTVCLVLCYALFFTISFYIVRQIVSQTIDLLENIPKFYENVVAPIVSSISQNLKLLQGKNIFGQIISDAIFGFEGKVASFASELPVKAAAWTANLALNIPEIFITFTVTVVSSFFICTDYEKISQFFHSFVSERVKLRIMQIKTSLITSVFKLVKCYITIFLLTYGELFLGLFLLNVRFPAAVALAIAFADILPFIGTGTVLIPWTVLELVRGKVPLALGLFVLYLIITVVRNIIEPKLIGKNIGIHPLITLAAMYIGLKFGGAALAVILPFVLITAKALNDDGVFMCNKLSAK